MTARTTIENAYYGHDHDLFHAELKKLLADKERLDYMERIRLKSVERGGKHWENFCFRATDPALTVRTQLDAEREA